jgi:prevent-host-death family protein
MGAKTIDDARRNLDQLMDQAPDNAEPTIITRTSKSAAVLVSLDEWNNLQAPLELVRSPANRDRINRAMRDADAGTAVPRELVAK